MTMFDFIDKHPWLTLILIVVIFEGLADIVKAFK